MGLIEYGKSLNVERPRFIRRFSLTSDVIGTTIGLPDELDLSGIVERNGKLYAVGNGNKRIYEITPPPDTVGRPMVSGIFNFPSIPGCDLSIEYMIGITTAKNNAGEHFYLIGMMKGVSGDTVIILFRMKDDFTLDEYFIVDSGIKKWPDYKTKEHGRGICSDGVYIYLSGGECSEHCYQINQNGALIRNFLKGDSILAKEKRISFIQYATGEARKYTSYYLLASQQYTSEQEVKQVVVETLIQSKVIPDTSTPQNIEFIWNSQGSFFYATELYYLSPFAKYPFNSGMTLLHNRPLIGNRSKLKFGVTGEGVSVNALVRFKNKNFEPMAADRIYGLEPFSMGIFDDCFKGDLHFDGKHLWATQAICIYQYDIVYHCYVLNNNYYENIDLDLIRKGGSNTLAVKFRNCSEIFTLTNVKLKIREDINKNDDDYINLSYGESGPVKEITISSASPGQEVEFTVQGNIPEDYSGIGEESKVAILEVSYEVA